MLDGWVDAGCCVDGHKMWSGCDYEYADNHFNRHNRFIFKYILLLYSLVTLYMYINILVFDSLLFSLRFRKYQFNSNNSRICSLVDAQRNKAELNNK